MGSYSWYWLETRVPIPVVWRVGWVAGTHRLNSAGFWWSGMVAERRGLQLGSSGFQAGVTGNSGGRLATVGTRAARSNSSERILSVENGIVVYVCLSVNT